MSTATKPLRMALCLFPGYQALDVFGPMDCFNLLTKRNPGALQLYVLGPTLDPIDTIPGTLFSQKVVPTHTYESPPEGVDILFVPGGFGLREDVSYLPKYLAASFPTCKYLLTVCTGSAVSATSGILDNINATTNKASWDWAVAHSSAVNWIHEARWVVDKKEDKEYWTSSGVSAGIDMALAWIESKWGQEEAESVARIMEYEWHKDASWDPFSQMYPKKA